MMKSNIFNMKWIVTYIMCSLLFGAFVPEEKAIKVAQNIYLEHANLHSGEKFDISYVETIKKSEFAFLYP